MNNTNKMLGSKRQFQIVLGVFIVLTAFEVLNLLSGRMLSQFGNIPRQVSSFSGIIIGPFLHGSLSHYLSNIFVLCLFSALVLQYGLKRYIYTTALIIILSGLLVWLFGRSASHIGASGLIYGYFAFLLLAGFLSGKFKLIVISLLVAFFYGGLIFGVIPANSFVSWESHLFGFISGLIAAKLWAKVI